MNVAIIKSKKDKRPGYRIKILSTAIQRTGRVVADISQYVEFNEDKEYGNPEVMLR